MNKKVIKKNIFDSIWIAFSNGYSSLIQWILVLIMTKTYSLEMVGLYSSAVALIVPLISLFGLNVRAIQLTDVEHEFKVFDFYLIKVFASVLSVIFAVGVTLAKGNGSIAITFVIIVLLQRIAEMHSEIPQNEFIRKQDFLRYGLSIVIRSTLSFMAFLALNFLFNEIIIALLGYAIVWVLMFLFYDAPKVQLFALEKNYSIGVFSRELRLVKLCIPLAIVACVNTLYDSIPKYVLEHFSGLEMLGIFSATSYISLIGGLFVTAITTVYATKLAELYKDKDYRRVISVIIIQEVLVVVCCVFIFLIFAVWGDIIVPLLYTDEFLNYMDVVLLLIAALSFNFTSRVMGTACTALRKNNHQLITAAICISVLLICSLILIPIHGLIGAALSLLITYILKNICLLTVLVVSFRSAIKQKKSVE